MNPSELTMNNQFSFKPEIGTPMPSSSVPFSWEDDEEVDNEKEESKEDRSLCSCLYQGPLKHLPDWSKRIINLFLLCVLILVPGVIDYIVFTVKNEEQLIRIPTHGYILLGGYPLVIWCLFAVGCIVVFNLCLLFVWLVPSVFGNLARLFAGDVPKHYEIYVGYINDLRWYISVVLFAIILNVVWHILFRPDLLNTGENGWRMVIFKIINCFLIINVFLSIQKLLIQIIAVRFHRTAYLDRLKQTSSTTDVIAKLNRVARKILKKRAQAAALADAMSRQKRRNIRMHQEPKKLSTDDISLMPSIDSLETGKKHKRSASSDGIATSGTALALSNESINQHTVTSMTSINPDQAASESNKDFTSIAISSPSEEDVSLKHKHPWFLKWDTRSKMGSDSSLDNKPSHRFIRLARQIAKGFNLNSTQEAVKVARKIYEAFVPDPSTIGKHAHFPADRPFDCLILEDFLPHFKTRLEAEKALKVFDRDENGSVSRQELKETVVGLYKERKSLSQSLRDVGSAVGKLDIMMTVLTIVISIFSCLLVFGISLGSFLVTGLSLILAGTFMIGNAAATMFEGVIFLFITHPFDVGDRVFIENQNYIVKELGILTTVLTRWDGQLVYSPNSVLSTKSISNIRRSPNQLEVAEIAVAFDTPLEKLNLLRQRMADFVARESREYVPRMELHPIEIDSINKIRIQIFIEHRANWQDGEKRFNRRNRFLLHLKEQLLELEIVYKKLPERIHITNKVTMGDVKVTQTA